jgi:glycosyltransferase involved in cell wall biosynthesis
VDAVIWLNYGVDVSPGRPYAGVPSAVFQMVKTIENDLDVCVVGSGRKTAEITEKTSFIGVKARSEIDYIRKSINAMPDTKILQCAHNRYYTFTREKKFKVVLHVHSPELPLIWHPSRVSGSDSDLRFFRDSMESLGSWLGRRNQGVDGFLSCSRYLADKMKALFPEAEFTVIPHALDLSEVPAKKPERDSILFVGALVDVKGVKTLIEVARILEDKAAGTKVKVIGSSRLWNMMEDDYYKGLAKDLGNMEFLGGKTRDEVFEHMLRARVGVVPSKDEGFCLVALEYQACGTPVVASNVGALPEVLEDCVTGFLVPPDSPEEFAEKIVFLLENPKIAASMGSAGRERVRKLFNPKDCAKRYSRFYSNVLHGR